jgi:ADP-ribose pyrophosphatase YjhB (NUDIX family)
MARFCPECGTPLTTRAIEGRDLQACPACAYVRWPDPKLVTITLAESDGALVFGRRAIEPGYGLWCLPGGFVNDDEHPAAAAARECLEEVGAHVEIAEVVGIYHIAKPGGQGMVAIAYRGTVVDPGAIAAGSEMLEVALLPPQAAPDLAFPTHRAAMNDWLRTRESSLQR